MPPDFAELRRRVERHGAGLPLYARRLCRGPEDAAQMALAKFALLPTPRRIPGAGAPSASSD